jgi:DNA invertase Pin-like site-specific DNA recombinase
LDKVVATDPARLARDTAQLAAVLGRFEELGIEVVFADQVPQTAEHDR